MNWTPDELVFIVNRCQYEENVLHMYVKSIQLTYMEVELLEELTFKKERVIVKNAIWIAFSCSEFLFR